MSFAGSVVQFRGDEVEVVARVDGQVCALGEVLAEQPVGVLVAARASAGRRRRSSARWRPRCERGLVISRPWSQVRVRRSVSGSRAIAVIAEALFCPTIRSPSQCPGTARSSTSPGRSAMLTMSGIRPRRSPSRRCGLRIARPVRRCCVRRCIHHMNPRRKSVHDHEEMAGKC